MLNKGEEPADDTPNFGLSEKVAKLIEYMVERLAQNNFQGQSLSDWGRYLDLVCQRVVTTEFVLNFNTAVEFQAFNQLRSSIDNSTEYKKCVNSIC